MKNTNSNKWLYFLAGLVIGALVYWLAMKIIGPLVAARQIQKEISQDLATGDLSNLQKHINNLQKKFPAVSDFSEEKVNKMIEALATGKEKESSSRDKKKTKV